MNCHMTNVVTPWQIHIRIKMREFKSDRMSSNSVIQKIDDQNSRNECQVLFPEIIDDKISTELFLTAARDVVRIIDKFGKIFAPVKYDMQGNIDKLSTRYLINPESNSSLQDMILLEKGTEEKLVATDALMWLRRGLRMIQLFFEEIINDYKAGKATEDLVAFLQKAYKEALEPHHGWMAQQLFSLLSRMVPTRSQLLRSLASDQANKDELILQNMEEFLVNLKKNIAVLQKFYEDHGLETHAIV